VAAFIGRYQRVYVVEQNRDAQLKALLKMDLAPELTGRLRSVRHYNGMPLDARSVTDEILIQEGKRGAPAAEREQAAAGPHAR
jgi:2-oxoglutarate/2-oxoacid ferredoxin oxidoreductase subunit alpha